MPSIGQLRWLCRRGTKELDRILGGYLEQGYLQADQATQQAFVELLGRQDPDIYDWLMGANIPTEPQIQKIVLLLQTMYGIVTGE